MKKQILILSILIMLLIMFTGCGKKELLVVESSEILKNTETESTEQVQELEESNVSAEIMQGETIQESAIQFPMVFEDGKLEVTNIFRFDGINPDCDNQEGSDIAAIEVKNLSNVYLTKATFNLKICDGSTRYFAVSDLPAGKTAWIFEVNNESIESDALYSDIVCEAQFDSEASVNNDMISVQTEGTVVSVKNNTSTEIKEIVLYCHSTLGEQYFGGATYTYTLNNLSPEEIAEVDVKECILGFTEVVRMEINE